MAKPTPPDHPFNHFCHECTWMQICPLTGLSMCRRHAPRPVATGVRVVARWPTIENCRTQAACGDFEKK